MASTENFTCRKLTEEDLPEIVEFIEDQVSLGVFDSNGRLIRLNMAQIQEKAKPYEYPVIVGEDCPGHKTRIRFIHLLESDIFSELGTNKVMVSCLDTGHPAYHGQRLWKKFKIYDLFESFARENGCDYIVSSAVSVYAQKILIEAGFSVIKEIKYSEYIDPMTECKPDLNLSEIHTSAMLMCKKVV